MVVVAPAPSGLGLVCRYVAAPSLGPQASLPGSVLDRPSISTRPATASAPRTQSKHGKRAQTGVSLNTEAMRWRLALDSVFAASFVGYHPVASTMASVEETPVTRTVKPPAGPMRSNGTPS